MRLGSERLGPRGLLVLGATGVLAAALAVHGYGRGTLFAAGTTPIVGVGTGVSPPLATTHSPSASVTSPNSASGSSAQKLGPVLATTQYAPYAYQLYPGRESSQAHLATAGFSVSVRPTNSGIITVSISAAGSGQRAQTTTYPASDRVYFIEASFGDDSGNTEYNTGDDGIIITDRRGRIVQ